MSESYINQYINNIRCYGYNKKLRRHVRIEESKKIK